VADEYAAELKVLLRYPDRAGAAEGAGARRLQNLVRTVELQAPPDFAQQALRREIQHEADALAPVLRALRQLWTCRVLKQAP
jgi:hypothetical protein